MDAFVIILSAILVSTSNSLIGSFLVLRKNVMIGDAISHAVLPGLVIGFFISESRNSFPILLSAAIAGFLCTVFIQLLSRSKILPKDASTGFVFTLLFAIGIILVSTYASNIDIDPDCVLHGEIGYLALEENVSIMGIESFPVSTWYILITTLFLAIAIALFRKQLVTSSFDPLYGETIGYRSNFWDLTIMGVTSFVTVISFEMVGAILVVAFMSIPVATAYLISKKLNMMILISILIGIMGSISGYLLANLLNTSISAAIVSVMGVMFISSLLIKNLVPSKKLIPEP